MQKLASSNVIDSYVGLTVKMLEDKPREWQTPLTRLGPICLSPTSEASTAISASQSRTPLHRHADTQPRHSPQRGLYGEHGVFRGAEASTASWDTATEPAHTTAEGGSEDARRELGWSVAEG